MRIVCVNTCVLVVTADDGPGATHFVEINNRL